MEFVTMGWENQMGSIPIGFQPSDLTGLKLWTRFNSGITETGSGVSQWDDVSGNGNHLLQAVDLDRPQKQADGSIITDGIRQFLKAAPFTWNQPETIYILGRTVTWTLNDRWFDGNAANSGTLSQNAVTPELKAYAGTFSSANGGLAVGDYGVIAIVFNGVSGVFQIDNNTPLTGDYGLANMSGLTLGASGTPGNFGHVQYKEVIGYDGAHDAAQRLQIINYLAGVGGLSI